jgi:hypothetical protein
MCKLIGKSILLLLGFILLATPAYAEIDQNCMAKMEELFGGRTNQRNTLNPRDFDQIVKIYAMGACGATREEIEQGAQKLPLMPPRFTDHYGGENRPGGRCFPNKGIAGDKSCQHP